jgi:SAM-dependent methyltransferase
MTDALTDAARGQVNTAAAEIYDTFFLPALFDQWPERVLDAAGVGPGDRVLDVGCGTGVLTRAAARRVGAAGQVIGLDPNEAMLAVAGRSVEPIGWQLGAAEAIPVADTSVDRVVSQFALMFFTDRPTAVTELARVLRPGGTTAIAVWAALELTPGYAAMAALLDELVGPDAAAALRAPYVLGDARALEELLSPSFGEVVVQQVDGLARFASIDDWVYTEIRGWTLADAIDDGQFERLRSEARVRLAAYADAAGRVAFPAPALIASGRRPR